MTKRKMDMLSGSLWDKILLFALPIALSSILQQLFNTADVAVVGRFVGTEALAAVGCTGPIVNLFITIFTGLAVGANAVIARLLGAGNKAETRRSIHTAMALAILAGAIIAVVGELLSRPLLVLTGAPAEVLELAVRYLRIYFVGSFFLMIYNFEAAILRASGDTRRPLYCLMFTGCVNIALNLFFVLVCKMNVEGVALATLAADILSAVLLFVSLSREKDVLRLDWRAFAIHADVAKEILLIGIPAAIQGMLFNIANIVIQSGINSLGADVVAASTIGLNMEVFAYYIVTGFGQAAITFNSQNLGAGQIRRCESATRWCLLLGAVFALATSFGMITCRDLLAGIFTSDPAIRQLAGLRITIVVGFEILNMVVEVLSGALRGLGHAFVPTALSILFVCVVRVGWLLLFFPAHHTFSGLLMVYPVSWALASTAISVAYFIIQKRLCAEG